MYRFATLRIIVYFILTGIILIVSFFPIGYVINFVVTDGGLVHYLLSPFYLFLGYCLTVIIFGIVHSQFAVRLALPYTIAPGVYPHHSSDGQLVGIRISADGIFKSMIKVFTFLPFAYQKAIFPYSLRLYGLKCGKNVHLETRTYIETAGLVEIGENSFIGYNSVVTGHANENRSIIVNPTKIGKNVHVGSYSLVASGCTIGDGSVLADKSGIIKDHSIPANQVWVGLPAKYLKDRDP
ncbi:MAG: acyltransferase [Candidatus Hodarchaeales archaeon]|jgi:acetyltransferase-like isoleucine patch superfamily enzyme